MQPQSEGLIHHANDSRGNNILLVRIFTCFANIYTRTLRLSMIGEELIAIIGGPNRGIMQDLIDRLLHAQERIRALLERL